MKYLLPLLIASIILLPSVLSYTLTYPTGTTEGTFEGYTFYFVGGNYATNICSIKINGGVPDPNGDYVDLYPGQVWQSSKLSLQINVQLCDFLSDTRTIQFTLGHPQTSTTISTTVASSSIYSSTSTISQSTTSIQTSSSITLYYQTGTTSGTSNGYNFYFTGGNTGTNSCGIVINGGVPDPNGDYVDLITGQTWTSSKIPIRIYVQKCDMLSQQKSTTFSVTKTSTGCSEPSTLVCYNNDLYYYSCGKLGGMAKPCASANSNEICLNNNCVWKDSGAVVGSGQNLVKDCPYECCDGTPGYVNKICQRGSCVNNNCIVIPQPNNPKYGLQRDCTTEGPCGENESSCHDDTDCQSGLTCIVAVGGQYGYTPAANVCIKTNSIINKEWDGYPLILVHGYENSNAAVIKEFFDRGYFDMFREFSKKLNDDGLYINKGYVLTGTNKREISCKQIGSWGNNKPIVVTTTFYLIKRDNISEYVDLSAGQGIPEYAKRLKNVIDRVKECTGAQKVDIIAHSMGGLVAREYVAHQGGASYVNKLITIGTPNKGLSLNYGLTYGLCNADSLLSINNGIECNEMLSNSDFIRELGNVVNPVKYYTIGSYINNGIPNVGGDDVIEINSTKIDGAQSYIVDGCTHSNLYDPNNCPEVYAIVKQILSESTFNEKPSLYKLIKKELLRNNEISNNKESPIISFFKRLFGI